MRSIVVLLSGSMVVCSSLVACVHEERVAPNRAARTTSVNVPERTQPAATIVEVQSRGVTNLQAEAAQPVVVANLTQPAATDAYVTTPASSSPLSDDVRAQTSQAVASASRQIDRLRRMESASTDLHRQDIESALNDLENKRGRVLQDLRGLELQPVSQAADLRAMLQGDIADLLDAVRASYFVAPSPAQGLPRPSPLPPSSIH